MAVRESGDGRRFRMARPPGGRACAETASGWKTAPAHRQTIVTSQSSRIYTEPTWRLHRQAQAGPLGLQTQYRLRGVHLKC